MTGTYSFYTGTAGNGCRSLRFLFQYESQVGASALHVASSENLSKCVGPLIDAGAFIDALDGVRVEFANDEHGAMH